jgi:hypothetical protein
MNIIGLVAGITTFLTIWFGHVMVREVEKRVHSILPPILICIGIALACFYGSLKTSSLTLSSFLGILGVTFLWDALEFYRQEHRIKKGHAPANPKNPRHAEILSKYSNATTHDLLKREAGSISKTEKATL